jgi:hypothetical protein
MNEYWWILVEGYKSVIENNNFCLNEKNLKQDHINS